MQYIDDFGDAIVNAACKIAGAKFWRDDLANDALGNGIGEHTLGSATSQYLQLAVPLGDDEQDTIVDIFATKLPRLGHTNRVIENCLRLRGRNDQHSYLRALFFFKRFEPRFDSRLICR